nr:reverse transcriptase domain-containing protein [Tanacetum cinerariifolium]
YHAPTEGYVEAIVVPSILAEQFELKHSLINIMTSDQFFELEKDNPHDHIRWFNKLTSTIKYKDVPNSTIKLMFFPSLSQGQPVGGSKKNPRDLFSLRRILFPNSLMNSFPSRTINLRIKISNFQQGFDESFHEAWDRYKDLLRACPHHGFTELHQLDTFYNALNSVDQDSLNSVTGGNLLERRTQDVLTIIENKSKCLAASGNTFLKLRDNIQGYISAATVNYNQVNSSYRPSVVPLSELEKIKRMNEANMKAMQTQINNVKNELRNEMKNSIQASMSNQTNKLKNMMASFFQMNTASTSGSGSLPSNTIANLKGDLKAITNRSCIVLDGPSVPIPPPFINLDEDERVEETLTDQDLAEYTIKVPPPLKLPEKLGDPRKFLIPYGFSELKYKALADLANRAICTPTGIERDVFISVGKFTFPADFVIVDYESDPRVPLILGRPFLQTARALIDVHREEMILCDGHERLTLNMRHDTSSYSNQPQKESINMINIFNDSKGGSVLIEKLRDLDSTKDPREKLLNINLLIAKIKSLNDNPTPDHVLKPLSPSPIHVEDNDSFLEKSDTSLSYSDNSLPEYETFINHTEETNSGSTTTHADYSLPKYDSFYFEIEPDQGKLTSVVMKDNLAKPRVHVPNVLTTHPTLMSDLDFIPSDNSLPEYEIFYFDIKEKNSGSTTIHADISLPDLECFNFNGKPDPGELTSIVDSRIREDVLAATNVNLPLEDDHSPLFAYVVWIFLSFLTYLVVLPNLLSFGNEDTIFDPVISNYHFPSLFLDVSHRCETFIKFNVYPKLLNESPMEILSSTCSPMEQ